MGLMRSRTTLSAFVPAPADTGWLPGDEGKLRPNDMRGQASTRNGGVLI